MIALRPLVAADAPELLALLEDNRDWLRRWDATRDASWLTVERQRGEAITAERAREAGIGFHFAVVEAGAMIGRVNLVNVVRGAFDNGYLGYWIARDRVGRGAATAAVGEALRFAFAEAKLHRVQAAVMKENSPSLRVLEKHRFREEGIAERYLHIDGAWRDHRIFAITVEEWGGRPGSG